MKMLSLAIAAAFVTTVAGSAAMAQGKGKTAAAHNGASSYQAKTSRGAAAGTIVRTWGAYVQKLYGTSPSAWARNMAPTFAQADSRNLQRAARMTTFEGMMSALMGQRASDAKIIDKMARANGSLAAIQALGSPSEDLVYTGVVPCRLFDTRVMGGAIAAGETRNFISSTDTDFTAQGGAATDCGIPAGAAAVVINVTSVRPTAPGYLTVFPYNSTRPLAASVNFIVAADNGNELIAKQTMGQAFDFSVFAFRQSHVTGDVAGYFAAPLATTLDCQNVLGPQTLDVPSVGLTTVSVSCPAGYTATGGGNLQSGAGSITVKASFPTLNGWSTIVSRDNGGTVNAQAVARCCRVPGR